MVKNLPAMWETPIQSLGWEDPLEKGMTTHSSILAWEILWTEEPGGLQSMRFQRVSHSLATKQQPCPRRSIKSSRHYKCDQRPGPFSPGAGNLEAETNIVASTCNAKLWVGAMKGDRVQLFPEHILCPGPCTSHSEGSRQAFTHLHQLHEAALTVSTLQVRMLRFQRPRTR